MIRYLLLLSFLALLAGCGDDTPAQVPPVTYGNFPECNPAPGHLTFAMRVCRGYVDNGTCEYGYGDGRVISAGDCWTQAGTCVWSCEENKQ